MCKIEHSSIEIVSGTDGKDGRDISPTRLGEAGAKGFCCLPESAHSQCRQTRAALRALCRVSDGVTIPPGERWAKYNVWKFNPAEVPDGKYRATVTFIPEKKTASVEFEITSVH